LRQQDVFTNARFVVNAFLIFISGTFHYFAMYISNLCMLILIRQCSPWTFKLSLDLLLLAFESIDLSRTWNVCPLFVTKLTFLIFKRGDFSSVAGSCRSWCVFMLRERCLSTRSMKSLWSRSLSRLPIPVMRRRLLPNRLSVMLWWLCLRPTTTSESVGVRKFRKSILFVLSTFLEFDFSSVFFSFWCGVLLVLLGISSVKWNVGDVLAMSAKK